MAVMVIVAMMALLFGAMVFAKLRANAPHRQLYGSFSVQDQR
jgi:hypothetical protein